MFWVWWYLLLFTCWSVIPDDGHKLFTHFLFKWLSTNFMGVTLNISYFESTIWKIFSFQELHWLWGKFITSHSAAKQFLYTLDFHISMARSWNHSASLIMGIFAFRKSYDWKYVYVKTFQQIWMKSLWRRVRVKTDPIHTSLCVLYTLYHFLCSCNELYLHMAIWTLTKLKVWMSLIPSIHDLLS